MDQGLKERLVGAAVLVAIGVWLIPWVLDGSEDPVDSSSHSLQLPSAEEPVPMRTQTLRLGGAEEPVAAPEVAAEAAIEAAPAAVANTRVIEPPAAVVAPAPVRTSTPPARVTPEVARAAPPPAAVAAPRAAPTASASGDWVVQLGSFGDEANARRLAERSTAVGYKATLSSYKSGSRTMYRVRVGSYESRGQADAAASALAAHGLRGQVVAAD